MYVHRVNIRTYMESQHMYVHTYTLNTFLLTFPMTNEKEGEVRFAECQTIISPFQTPYMFRRTGPSNLK